MTKKLVTLVLFLFITLVSIYSPCDARTRPGTLSHKNLPRIMTPEERLEKERLLREAVFMRSLAPPSGIVNHPAEFADMQGILLRWDYGWPDFEPMYCDMIDAIVDVAKVYMLYRTAAQKSYVESVLTTNGIPLTSIDWIIARTDSIWARDYGPFIVYKEDFNRGITDFLYYPSRPNDDTVPHALSMTWAWELFEESFYFEGGNFMTDGFGKCFVTDSVYSANPGLTRQDMEDIFRDYCGCHETHVLKALMGTIGHIDMHIKLLDVDTVLIGEVAPDDPNYDILENAVSYFGSLTASNGNPYEILRVPMLSGFRTYTNSLLVNGTALVPTYTEPEDATALSVYTTAGFTAVPIESSLIIPLSGATHCITKEIPVPCSTPPVTPTGVAAANLGNNRIEISWTDTGAPVYYVYRSTTDCSTDMEFYDVSTTNTFIDNNADNGVTYYYQVSSVDNCMSDPSTCVSETGSGYCIGKPVFAGIKDATNQHLSDCSIKLVWDPAAPVCGSGAVYNIYRSSNPDFTPSTGNLIAACVTGTEYIDESNLDYREQYFYIVRAEDDSGSARGNCGCGNEDDNTVIANTVATGSTTAGTYVEDFESGPNGWTAKPAGLWHMVDNSTCASPYNGYRSATHSWYYGRDGSCDYDTGSVTFGYLLSPVIIGVSSSSVVSFYHYRHVESSSYFMDESTVEVSADGGRSWDYVWYRSSNDSSPDIWEHSGNISLAAYAGSNIILKFGFNSYDDWYNDYPGWFIDDVTITNIEIPSPCTTKTLIPVWSNIYLAVFLFMAGFSIVLVPAVIRKNNLM